MATASFKSTSRRGGAATEPKAPPPAAASRRRSHSVSAVSRKIHVPFDDTPISTEFSNRRDNPLFWSRSYPSPDKEEGGGVNEIATVSHRLSSTANARSTSNGSGGGGNSSSEQRGRSVTRSASHSNGIGRSVSRVRGRSVSTVSRNGAYEVAF